MHIEFLRAITINLGSSALIPSPASQAPLLPLPTSVQKVRKFAYMLFMGVVQDIFVWLIVGLFLKSQLHARCRTKCVSYYQLEHKE